MKRYKPVVVAVVKFSGQSQWSRSGEESDSWATEIPARRRGRERRVEESGKSNRHTQFRLFEERIEIAGRRTVGEGEVEEKKW